MHQIIFSTIVLKTEILSQIVQQVELGRIMNRSIFCFQCTMKKKLIPIRNPSIDHMKNISDICVNSWYV